MACFIDAFFSSSNKAIYSARVPIVLNGLLSCAIAFSSAKDIGIPNFSSIFCYVMTMRLTTPMESNFPDLSIKKTKGFSSRCSGRNYRLRSLIAS